MTLDSKLTKEQLLQNIDLLESRLSKDGIKTQETSTNLIVPAKEQNPRIFLMTTLRYTLDKEDYQGVLTDMISQTTYPTNPHLGLLTTFRELIINHDDKQVIRAARSLGGYEKRRKLFIPSFHVIKPDIWQLSYEGNAFDTNMHLEMALCEFQDQLRNRDEYLSLSRKF
jgi:hypothetical protein